MANETIHNPVTGETLYVLASTEKIFQFEYSIRPGSSIAAEHLHPFQEQTVYVLEGKLGCRINGSDHVLSSGEWVKIPAGTRHFQWNPTHTEARAIEEIRPAGRAHNMFRVAFALARDGKTDSKGVPKPLIGAALVAEFKDVVRPTAISLRILFGLLGPISYLLGYRRIIRKYIEEFEADDLERTPVIQFQPGGQHGTTDVLDEATSG